MNRGSGWLSALSCSVAVTLVVHAAPQQAASDAELKEAEHDVPVLMQVLDVTPGMTVADVGAGAGAMTIVTARWLGPRGRVYSTDINEAQVRAIADQVTHGGLTNVVTLVGADASTNLPDACCDAIWLRDVYHHLKDPIALDRSLRAALKPGGRVAIIDFEPAPGSQPPPGVPANRTGHGILPAIVVRELTEAGLTPVRTIATWPEGPPPGGYFLVLFKKP
jgi:ubiquinone/menaquinone biosynthesis C-methylase UbiE